MPLTREGCQEYEKQLQDKCQELDRKLKDIQNMIRSSIANNMAVRASKYMDMGKEIKMQRDALLIRIQEVKNMQRMFSASTIHVNPLNTNVS